MTLRDNLTHAQAWAHTVLDDVRDGFPQPAGDVRLAVQILGEPVNA